MEGDAKGAEEYYGRAILASPGDGEVLSLYGKLVWETHRDGERAEAYFERAVEASPDDWYASFFPSPPNKPITPPEPFDLMVYVAVGLQLGAGLLRAFLMGLRGGGREGDGAGIITAGGGVLMRLT